MKARCSNFAACDIINCYRYSEHEPANKAVERPHHVPGAIDRFQSQDMHSEEQVFVDGKKVRCLKITRGGIHEFRSIG